MAKVNFDEWCSEIDCTNNARITFNGKFYCDRHALYILQDIANEHGEGINIGELIESLESIAETIDNGEVQTGLEMMNNVMMSLAIQNAAQQKRAVDVCHSCGGLRLFVENKCVECGTHR